MNRERLMELRRVACEFPIKFPYSFEMGNYVGKGECGTSVCLIGAAGLDPYFQALGIVTDPFIQMFTMPRSPLTHEHFLAEFFEISLEEADYLFFTFENNTSVYAAIERIDMVLRGEVQ